MRWARWWLTSLDLFHSHTTQTLLHTSQHRCSFHVGLVPSPVPFLDGGETRGRREGPETAETVAAGRGVPSRCAVSSHVYVLQVRRDGFIRTKKTMWKRGKGNHIKDYSELIEESIAALLAVLRSRPHLMVSSSAILSAMHHGLLLLRLRMPKMDCWD